MARRSNISHSWTLASQDPVAVPNARIALALLRCIRQLPGAFPDHDFDDLGAVLAPVFEGLGTALRATLKAHMQALAGRGLAEDEIDLRSATLLHDRRIQTLLGEAAARAMPRFRVLFDKAEAVLASFVGRTAHPSDRNIETLSGLLALPAPEVAFVRLATAFCYGTIERSSFSFVSSTSRLMKTIEGLCGVKGTKAMRLFDPDRPLARSALLATLSGKRAGGDLEDLLCLSAVGERLLSAPFADAAEMASAVLTPLPLRAGAPLQWPHLASSQSLLRAALGEAIQRGTPGFNVLLHGAPGTGKTEFARSLVAEIGATGFSIDHTDEHGGEGSRDDRLASLRLSQTFASQHHRAVLVLDEAEDIFQADHKSPFGRMFERPSQSKAWMNNLLETNPHPVLWISNQVSHLDPAYLRRFAFCLEFPRTPYALRRCIAEEQLALAGCSAQTVDAVASSDLMTPALLASAARFASLAAPSGLGPDLAVRSLIDGQARAAGHAGPPLPPRRSTRFDMRYLKLGGNATPQRLLRALQADGPATLMFCGPPGTGKTQLASELASQLGRQLVVRTASDINSKWYGESEGNVARMFRDCDPKAELLFLDEAEVLLGSRVGASHRADRAVTAEFLRWLEVFEGIFVCATNHGADFDAALMRRFTFRVDFNPLDRQQREDMYAELALDWQPAGGAARPPIDGAAASRLAELDLLTPGDFANAARRVRQLGLGAAEWMDELAAEHRAKGGAGSARIGFV